MVSVLGLVSVCTYINALLYRLFSFRTNTSHSLELKSKTFYDQNRRQRRAMSNFQRSRSLEAFQNFCSYPLAEIHHLSRSKTKLIITSG